MSVKPQKSEWAAQTAAALEAARAEVVRRLRGKGLPLSLETLQTEIIDNADHTGWQSVSFKAQVSGLNDHRALGEVRDESVRFSRLGLRHQLEELALNLARETDLGNPRPDGALPNQTGVDAVLVRYLAPLALHYLLLLPDLGVGDEDLAQRLGSELECLAVQRTITRVHQLAIGGVRTTRLLTHRNASVRPLSPLERGIVAENEGLFGATWPIRGTDLVPPLPFAHFVPTALLEVRTTRPREQAVDTSSLLHRVALAFFLRNLDLSSAGTVVVFDQPVWMLQGYSHEPFPVTKKLFTGSARTLSDEDLKAVVDLAHQMPDFTGSDSNRKEIVLDRVLRGSGVWPPDSGFLDFATALEAALLGGSRSELAYRFSLYGALFLREERDPSDTFRRLRNVYQVRSDLVHGSPVKPQARAEAVRDSAELGKAVVRRAVEGGWPNADVLDGVALDHHQALPYS